MLEPLQKFKLPKGVVGLGAEIERYTVIEDATVWNYRKLELIIREIG